MVYNYFRRPPYEGFSTTGPTLTQQQFGNEVDINTIMERSQSPGLPTMPGEPFFGDFVGLDYQEIQNKILEANKSFMTLDAHVRQRFENNPALLLKFMEAPENKAEAIALGLIKAPAAEAVVKAAEAAGT